MYLFKLSKNKLAFNEFIFPNVNFLTRFHALTVGHLHSQKKPDQMLTLTLNLDSLDDFIGYKASPKPLCFFSKVS